MAMGTYFGNFSEIRENPEFQDLMKMDKSHWPRCLLWSGWLPLLSGVNGASPWAGSADDGVLAIYLLECSMRSYSSHLLLEGDVLDGFDRDGALRHMLDNSNVCVCGFGGVLVLDRVSGALLGPVCMFTCLVMHGGIAGEGTLIWCSLPRGLVCRFLFSPWSPTGCSKS